MVGGYNWTYAGYHRGPFLSGTQIQLPHMRYDFINDNCCMADANVKGLVQDCANSSALAVKLPQSCAKPSISQYKFKYTYLI